MNFSKQMFIAAYVLTATEQIEALVRSGTVPKTLLSFSELHDYIDANLLGGAELMMHLLDPHPAFADEAPAREFDSTDICNAGMSVVDDWIRNGNLKAIELAPLGPGAQPLKFGDEVRLDPDYSLGSVQTKDKLIVIRDEKDGLVSVASSFGSYADMPRKMFLRR